MGLESFILTGANVFPELALSILDAWQKRDFETARKKQELYSKAYAIMEKYGKNKMFLMVKFKITYSYL